MTELKCPIHDTELAHLDVGVYGHTGCDMTGNKKLWQALINTKKKLDVCEECCRSWEINYHLEFEKSTRLENQLKDTKEKLDIANERVDMYMGLAAYAKKHIDGLNSMLESWYKLLQSDKDTATKYAILKSVISAYVENKKEEK